MTGEPAFFPPSNLPLRTFSILFLCVCVCVVCLAVGGSGFNEKTPSFSKTVFFSLFLRRIRRFSVLIVFVSTTSRDGLLADVATLASPTTRAIAETDRAYVCLNLPLTKGFPSSFVARFPLSCDVVVRPLLFSVSLLFFSDAITRK